jgi:repressor LexA
MYPKLTKKQKLILEYIKVYMEINGVSPSMIDIKNHFRLGAVSTVHEHLENLKQKGYISKEMNSARSVRPIDPMAEGQDFIEIPVLGTINSSQIYKPGRPVKNILIHKTMLGSEGKYKYFALRVNSEELTPSGFRLNDILILKEDKAGDNNSFVLAEIDKDQVVFRQLSTDKGVSMLITPDSARTVKVFRRLKIRGQLVSLMRNY